MARNANKPWMSTAQLLFNLSPSAPQSRGDITLNVRQENQMSSRLKFSMGWCMLFAILHAAGTLYVCVATALFSPENHIAWYWNPLAMKFLYSSGNIMSPVILGLPVSGLIGIFFGYLIPVFRRKRSVQDPIARPNSDLTGTPWEKNSSHTSDRSNNKKPNKS